MLLLRFFFFFKYVILLSAIFLLFFLTSDLDLSLIPTLLSFDSIPSNFSSLQGPGLDGGSGRSILKVQGTRPFNLCTASSLHLPDVEAGLHLLLLFSAWSTEFPSEYLLAS